MGCQNGQAIERFIRFMMYIECIEAIELMYNSNSIESNDCIVTDPSSQESVLFMTLCHGTAAQTASASRVVPSTNPMANVGWTRHVRV